MSRHRLVPYALLSFLAVAGPAGAGAASSTSESPPSSAPADTLAGEINVFAAASLTEAFEQIGEAFEAEHPDVDVVFNFAASSDLVTAIVDDGAPADVFASADQNNMDRLVEGGRNAGEPETFATNSLEIIVEPGNPLGITGVEDLADPDLIFVTCDPAVPIGAYTQQVLDAAGVTVTPASLEENVRGIVTKVTSGEADAGIVYATDVLVAGDDAEGVAIPDDINVVAEYPIAAVSDAPNPDGGTAFVEFVLSDPAEQVLSRHGFGPADAAADVVPSSDVPTGSIAVSTAPATTGG
jgi:molybdate transport system substrate-binding protein